MTFEWNDDKNRSNQKKHGVTFEEAMTVFHDPNILTKPDPDHSAAEERWLSIGVSERLRSLIIVYIELTPYPTSCTRIISARKATKKERQQYTKITGVAI